MAKRGSSENSGVSMLALIRQVLIDGKVHTAKQIADHMQQYMLKGMSPDRVLSNVKLLLDHHSQVEKTPKGYRLKGGSNLSHVVHEILGEEMMPVSEKEIVKQVAKKQGVPADMIRLDLENDSKIVTVTYKSRKFYYLSGRKNANEKVYKLLKSTNKPMSVDEIFSALETSSKSKRDKMIFLPREDNRIVKSGSKYTLKKKKKPKKAPARPRHLVTKEEMDAVVSYLETQESSYAADELSRTVLDRPLEETNLRFKLARDRRLKRDDNRFYFEKEEEEKQVPEKIKDRVEKEYYKVKARMMGSTEIQTVAKLLDRIYGVNMAHQEFSFYQRELEDHLMHDEEAVLLLDQGWVHVSNEPRAQWVMPDEFQPIPLPDPPARLPEEKVTATEKEFLEYGLYSSLDIPDDAVALVVTPVHRKHGVVRLPDGDMDKLPMLPKAYELLVSIPDEHASYEAFVLHHHGVIRGLESVFSERLPLKGGQVRIIPSADNPYKVSFQFAESPEPVELSADDISEVTDMIGKGIELPELIRWVFQTSGERFLSCYQIWASLNLIGDVSRSDILATLKDYDCFLPIKSMDGSYSLDKKAGMSRLSVVPEAEAPAGAVETETVQVSEPAEPAAGDSETKPAEEPVKEEPEKLKKTKARQKTKKESTRKRRRPVEVDEELPEHLLKLKSFERRLPKLKAAKQAQKPAARRKTRIGPVSIGKPPKGRARTAAARSAATEEPKSKILDVPAMPEKPREWDSATFVNPDKGKGHMDLHTTLEVLKTFVSRTPQVRRTDGSIVIFLDNNDLAIYFRIPPENQDCWLAWIPEQSLNSVKESDSWLTSGNKRAKKSDDGYWWATGKFKGPKGNFRDKNVLEGVEIVGKLLELMEKEKK